MPTTEERLVALEAKFNAQKTELDKTIREGLEKDKEITKLNAESQALFEAEGERQKVTERASLHDKLEKLVKERKVNPATREKFMRDFDEAEDTGKIVYAVDNLIKTIESNPSYFNSAETARINAEREEKENEMPADQVVLARVREYKAKHGEKNFNVAKRAVLEADPELALRYTRVDY